MKPIWSSRMLATTVAAAASSCALLGAGCADNGERRSPVARAAGAELSALVLQTAGCSRITRTAADGPRPGQGYIEWARTRIPDCCAAPGGRPRPSLQSLLNDDPADGR